MNQMKTPPSSQTVGPFWHNGLRWNEGNRSVFASGNDAITMFGHVYDGDGLPMADAMLEFFTSDKTGKVSQRVDSEGRNEGYVRSATDREGIYRIHISAPNPNSFLHVLVFARGLLTHVYTRVYFGAEIKAATGDAVLDAAVASGRAKTLFAERTAGNAFRWDLRMQGEGETVFFERS